ncbi:hypothetical protein NJ76_08600 [Rhodococcus sp. IITR03]|nr:hypothetical protein NJ76_08600 [Rhodococcus sp. IITR03]
MDSAKPMSVARSQVHTSPPSAVSRIDMSLMRTGSARAFRRSASSRAALSLMGAAETGSQQIGVLTSIMGRAFGMVRAYPLT